MIVAIATENRQNHSELLRNVTSTRRHTSVVSGLVVTPTIVRTTIHRIDTMAVIHEGFAETTVSELTLAVVLEDHEGLRDFRLTFLFHRETSVSIVEVDCGGRFVIYWLIHCGNRIPRILYKVKPSARKKPTENPPNLHQIPYSHGQ